MNKKQQRELENKLREATLEADDLTPERIDGIREKAHAAYLQTNTDTTRPKIKAKTGSDLLRRVAAVFAIAVGLIVMSVVYTALAPVSTGNANNLVRRAAIWINDQLHLGISFPVPEEGADISELDQEYFVTLREAAQSLNLPIIYFQSINGLSFNGLETISSESTSIAFLHYTCTLDDSSLDISIEALLDNEILGISQQDENSFLSPIGKLYIKESKDVNRAFALYEGYLIEIYGSVSREFFLLCCSSLAVIN